ncbi:hypothetical protein D3C75_952370 [compost metagenome]
MNDTVNGSQIAFDSLNGIRHLPVVTHISRIDGDVRTQLLSLHHLMDGPASWIIFRVIIQPLVPFLSHRESALNNSDGGAIVYGEMLSNHPPDHARSASDDIHAATPK